jgi:phosphatidylglycerophosphate synthase
MRERIDPDVFHAVNRGGGLATRLLAQPIGAVLAAVAYRIGASPAALTIAGMLLSVATSAAALSVTADLQDLPVSARVGLGVALWIGWLVAAALDCADGQLARVTRRASPAGAALDILCDVITQALFITALTAAAGVFAPEIPAPAMAFAGAMWMLTLVTSLLDKSGAEVTLAPSGSMLVALIKAPRDFTAQITLAVIVIASWPAGMVWLLGVFTAMNCLYVLALIARTAVRSASETTARQVQVETGPSGL